MLFDSYLQGFVAIMAAVNLGFFLHDYNPLSGAVAFLLTLIYLKGSGDVT